MSNLTEEQRDFLKQFAKSEHVTFVWSESKDAPRPVSMAYDLGAKHLLRQLWFRPDGELVSASWKITANGLEALTVSPPHQIG